MRRKRNNRGDLIIDLTSLLDVVFIILLVVIGNGYQNNANNKAQEEALVAAHESEIKELKADRDNYKTAYDAKELIKIVPISVPYEVDNVTKREIVIPEELGLDLAADELILEGTNEEAFDTFEKKLDKYIESNKDNPVILALNENLEDILYRDEKRMNEILDRLKSKHENMYRK